MCYLCNENFISRTMRLMRNFPHEKVRIAVTYRDKLHHPPLEIDNNFSFVCFNCDLLLTRDLESLQNPEHLRMKVLKQRSTELCMICNQLSSVFEKTLKMIKWKMKVKIKLY